VRAGVKVLSLSARGINGIGDAVSVHRPNLVVVAGRHVDDDTVARWAYAIRLALGTLPLAVYRRGSQRGRSTMLPSSPGEAQRRLLEQIEAEQMGRPVPLAPAERSSGAAARGPRAASL
jgi:MerR family transcriptional regulator, light-induced transcriptional regulator